MSAFPEKLDRNDMYLFANINRNVRDEKTLINLHCITLQLQVLCDDFQLRKMYQVSNADMDEALQHKNP